MSLSILDPNLVPNVCNTCGEGKPTIRVATYNLNFDLDICLECAKRLYDALKRLEDNKK